MRYCWKRILGVLVLRLLDHPRFDVQDREHSFVFDGYLTMNEHKHAWALRLLADGVPLEELEIKHIQGSRWITPIAASFVYQPDNYIVRRRQRTHVVNGFIVPAPEEVAPARGVLYYVPDVAFLTREDAIKNAKAMCGIDPNKQ